MIPKHTHTYSTKVVTIILSDMRKYSTPPCDRAYNKKELLYTALFGGKSEALFIFGWVLGHVINVTIQQLNSIFTPHFGILTYYSIKKNTTNHIFLLTLKHAHPSTCAQKHTHTRARPHGKAFLDSLSVRGRHLLYHQ